MNQEKKFLRLEEIIGTKDKPGLIPISRSSWYLGIKNGIYPAQIKIGPRIAAWNVSDINELVEKIAKGKNK